MLTDSTCVHHIVNMHFVFCIHIFVWCVFCFFLSKAHMSVKQKRRNTHCNNREANKIDTHTYTQCILWWINAQIACRCDVNCLCFLFILFFLLLLSLQNSLYTFLYFLFYFAARSWVLWLFVFLLFHGELLMPFVTKLQWIQWKESI